MKELKTEVIEVPLSYSFVPHPPHFQCYSDPDPIQSHLPPPSFLPSLPLENESFCLVVSNNYFPATTLSPERPTRQEQGESNSQLLSPQAPWPRGLIFNMSSGQVGMRRELFSDKWPYWPQKRRTKRIERGGRNKKERKGLHGSMPLISLHGRILLL